MTVTQTHHLMLPASSGGAGSGQSPIIMSRLTLSLTSPAQSG